MNETEIDDFLLNTFLTEYAVTVVVANCTFVAKAKPDQGKQ